MIAVAQAQKVSGEDLEEEERLELQRVDPLREVDLPADVLDDALVDPLVALAARKVPVDRLLDRAAEYPVEQELRDEQGEREQDDEEVEEEPETRVQPQGAAVTPAAEAPPEDEGGDDESPEDRAESGQGDVPGGPGSAADQPDDEPDDEPGEAGIPAPDNTPPEQPPVEPPEPLEAGGTRELGEAFARATPTQKALEYPDLGTEMDDLGKQEQSEAEDAVPTFHATLDDKSPLPPDREPAPPGARAEVDTPGGTAEVDDGATGRVEEPDLAETPRWGHFDANRGVGGTISQVPEDADASERAEAIDRELRQVSTRDDEVETSPGPPPQVPLSEDSDPKRIGKAAASGLGEAGRAASEAQQKVLDSPGQELVQPQVFDEPHEIGELKKQSLEQPPEVEGMEQYKELGLPAGVQAKFDEKYGDQMESSLEEGKQQIAEATEARDSEHQQELDRADREAQKLQQDAQKQQNEAVQEQREKIRDERAATMKEQKAAVDDLHEKTEAERKKHTKDIEKRIADDERKIQKSYADAQRDADKEVREGEREAQKKKEEAEKKKDDDSWWDRAVSAVSDFVGSIVDAVTAIFEAVRSAVASILEGVKALANNIIDAATKFVCDAIDAFAGFLKDAVNGLLADVFPKLAAKLNAYIDAAAELAKQSVNKIAEGLKKGIAALCDGVLAVLDGIISAWKTATQAALKFMEAALKGDWDALLTMVLESVLGMLGIAPEEFYAMVGKGEDTLGTIVNDPGKFVGNAIDAAVLGFGNFADNFGDHLEKGLVTWLTGELGDLQIPDKLTPMGVLDVVLQVMGLSKSKLRTKAVDLIGEDNVERIEFVWDFVTDLLDDSDEKGATGLAGLWSEIEKNVGSIWDEVIGGIKNWLVTRLVMKAVAKLATMFNPIGAIVQLILTVWNLYNWLKDNVQRIWGVVKAWVGSLADIAKGTLGPAAGKIEQALAGMVPIAISLLANIIGLRGITKRVRRIIERIQAKVDKAIDTMIERVKKLFPGRKKGAATGEESGGRKRYSGEAPEEELRKGVSDREKRHEFNKLNVSASWTVEVRNEATFERRYKRNNQVDSASLTQKINRYLSVTIPKQVVASGDAMFGMFGEQAYQHYAGETKAKLSNLVAEDGLKVTGLDITGEAPEGLTPEQVGERAAGKARHYTNVASSRLQRHVGDPLKQKVLDPAKKKFVDPVTNQVIDPARQKLSELGAKAQEQVAATWNKVKTKATGAIDAAVAPIRRGWDQARAGFEKNVVGPMKKAGAAAGRWTQENVLQPVNDRVVDPLKKGANKAAEMGREYVVDPAKKGAAWAKGKAQAFLERSTAAANKLENAAMRALSVAVKPLQAMQGFAETARDKVADMRQAVKRRADALRERARDLAERVVYGDRSQTTLQAIEARERGRQGGRAETSGADEKKRAENQQRDEKKEQERKEPQYGWETVEARSAFAARHRVRAGFKQITFSIDVGDADVALSATSPRALRDQVAFWKQRLDHLDARRRSTVAAALREAEGAVRSFDALGGNLARITRLDNRSKDAREKVAGLMVDRMREVGDAFATAYKGFDGWGETVAEKKQASDDTKDAAVQEQREALKSDVDKLKSQGLKVLKAGFPASDGELDVPKQHGWEYEDAAATLAACGDVDVLGLSFPVKVEVVNGDLDPRIDGLGYIKGLATLWDAFGPESDAQRARLDQGLGELKPIVDAFDAAGRRLDQAVSNAEDDSARQKQDEARAAAAREVADQAVTAAQKVDEIARAVGLPPAIGGLFEQAMQADHERTRAGWDFKEVRDRVLEASWTVAIGARQPTVTPVKQSATLHLQVGDAGTIDSLARAWRERPPVAEGERPAFFETLSGLDTALARYHEVTQRLRDTLGLDEAARAERVARANAWREQVERLLEALGAVGVHGWPRDEEKKQASEPEEQKGGDDEQATMVPVGEFLVGKGKEALLETGFFGGEAPEGEG